MATAEDVLRQLGTWGELSSTEQQRIAGMIWGMAHPPTRNRPMGFMFRKTKKIGPLRVTGSKSGLSVSGGGKRLRVGGSTSGRKRASANLGGGLRWTRSRSR
jgi:hypothetical protein